VATGHLRVGSGPRWRLPRRGCFGAKVKWANIENRGRNKNPGEGDDQAIDRVIVTSSGKVERLDALEKSDLRRHCRCELCRQPTRLMRWSANGQQTAETQAIHPEAAEASDDMISRAAENLTSFSSFDFRRLTSAPFPFEGTRWNRPQRNTALCLSAFRASMTVGFRSGTQAFGR